MGRKFDVSGARLDYFNSLVSTWSLYEAIKRKELPCARVGRRILLDENDLDAWWQRQTAGVQKENEVQRGILRSIQ